MNVESQPADSLPVAPLRRTPLHASHLAAGARMSDFGGWDMPIDFRGGGVVAEHVAVRESVAKFDVSHMGKLLVRGPGALAALNDVLTNDLNRVQPGGAQYTLLCLDATSEGAVAGSAVAGGVVDDLIAYVVSRDEVFLVPNASNASAVRNSLAEALPSGIDLVDDHERLSIIAVQGPDSERTLAALGMDLPAQYMSWRDIVWEGVPARVSRTGYTGERGYEIFVPASAAASLWEGLSIPAAGLGARDTLRTEMGYPLHGQDISPQSSPLIARLGWAIGWDKPRFHGMDALRSHRGQARPLLWGLRSMGRGVLRPHLKVTQGGTLIGETTSGTFSPTLRTGIALAVLDPSVVEGTEVEVDVRGRPLTCSVVRPPFVPARVK